MTPRHRARYNPMSSRPAGAPRGKLPRYGRSVPPPSGTQWSLGVLSASTEAKHYGLTPKQTTLGGATNHRGMGKATHRVRLEFVRSMRLSCISEVKQELGR